MNVITVTLNPALDYTLHVKNWQRGAVNRGERMDFSCGGKGLKVAVNLCIAGIDAQVTGFMGALNDQRFRDLFQKHQVQDDFIRIPNKETRRNVKIVDDSDGETTDVNLLGIPVCADLTQQLIAILDEKVKNAKVLVFGGSLPPNMDADFYAQMVKRYRQSGVLIAVDTSGSALSALMAADVLPDMIKPNIHELRELTGEKLLHDAEIIAAARRYIERGMQLVIVSMGEDGAWFVTREKALHASPPRVKVASTVGAGDAMVAGSLYGLLNDMALPEIAKIATAFGAANVENKGSFISSMQRVETLRRRVVVIDEGEER